MRLFRKIILAILALAMLAGLLLPAAVDAAPASSALSFRQVFDAPRDGASALPLADDPAERLTVGDQPLLSGSDVTCVGVANADRPDIRGVRLVFAGESKALLESVTRAHVGERIAVVLGGKVLMAPRLLDPVTGGEVLITAASDAEVTALEQAIHRDAGVAACPR